MKQFVINVPDDKQSFFEELMRNLDFSIEGRGMVNEPIPEWHKEEVRKRIENLKEEDYLPWDEVKRQIRERR
jgi:serine protease inhibitor